MESLPGKLERCLCFSVSFSLGVVEGILTIISLERDYLGTLFSLSYVSTRAVGPGQQINVETPDDFF